MIDPLPKTAASHQKKKKQSNPRHSLKYLLLLLLRDDVGPHGVESGLGHGNGIVLDLRKRAALRSPLPRSDGLPERRRRRLRRSGGAGGGGRVGSDEIHECRPRRIWAARRHGRGSKVRRRTSPAEKKGGGFPARRGLEMRVRLMTRPSWRKLMGLNGVE